MTGEYLFISDCHLDGSRRDIIEYLHNFLTKRANQAECLYVLGDLFEAWIGDDDPALDLAIIFDCFKSLSRQTDIYFIAGNRDFLLGDKAAERMGATILHEPSYLKLGNQRVALLHGDSLCTDDHEYQQFRKMVRGVDWQNEFLAKPLQERNQIAIGLREQSKAAMQHKSMDIMDVNQQSVIDSFAELGVDSIIHGHTHQPAVHDYGNARVRYVLGDWNPQPSYLSWRADNGFVLTDMRVAA